MTRRYTRIAACPTFYISVRLLLHQTNLCGDRAFRPRGAPRMTVYFLFFSFPVAGRSGGEDRVPPFVWPLATHANLPSSSRRRGCASFPTGGRDATGDPARPGRVSSRRYGPRPAARGVSRRKELRRLSSGPSHIRSDRRRPRAGKWAGRSLLL